MSEMKSKVLVVITCIMMLTNFAFADIIRGIDIDFVTIGNAGNSADTTGYGAVGHNYRIGKYEITNSQWNAFTGAAGVPAGNPSYAYDQSSTWTSAQQPTNNISWYEAAQFCNYLTSGQKYSGAYQFDGSGNFLGINRSTSIATYGTTYVIPTEDEWYKAAYFKPDASGYSLFANGTDVTPIAGVQSNYYNTIGSPWNVGSGTIIEQNGTFDMMGNVWEWNETLVDLGRGVRGAAYNSGDVINLTSSGRYSGLPDSEDNSISGVFGFRIASIPEPATLLLLGLGGLMLRKKKH